MSVTEKLLRVFRVDQQLGGLQSRLNAAEKFLSEQTKQLEGIDAKRTSIQSQLKQMQASIADYEGEMARLDARVETLREQMNSAKTNKEYKAFLTEVNTYKADRSSQETAALELMTKADVLKKQLAELDGQKGDRDKVRQVAAGDRNKREEEIRDRLNQLRAEREKLIADVPPDALKHYNEQLRTKGDEAMAPVQELDRRHHEYNCGSCQMTLPIETVAALIKSQVLTRCVSCGCILYIEKETADSVQPTTKKGKSKNVEVL
jgi:uncharacterized protein